MARLLVTRARPDAASTSRKIRALGHRALVAPLREAQSVLSPAPEKPAALIATSRNAFRHGAPIPPDWQALPVFCVGAATAKSAQEAGFSTLIAAKSGAESLLPLLAPFRASGAPLVYLAGSPRRPLLEEESGLNLSPWLRYRMVALPVLPARVARALRSRQIDAILHFSSESAEHFCALIQAAGLPEAAAWPIQACLSKAIAASIGASAPAFSAQTTFIIAKAPTEKSLIEAALAAALSRQDAQKI